MPKLTLQWEENKHTHHYTISSTESGPILIGRHRDCHIILDFATISRRHAELFMNNEAWYVRNLSGVNPIDLGNQQLGKQEQAILRNGAYFRIGPVWLQVIDLEAKNQGELKIKCRRCQNVVDYTPEEFCKWCGMALQAGETVFI